MEAEVYLLLVGTACGWTCSLRLWFSKTGTLDFPRYNVHAADPNMRARKRTHKRKCIQTRIDRAVEKGVGGLTQALWVTLTQSLRYNTHHCHSITSPTGRMDRSSPSPPQGGQMTRGEDTETTLNHQNQHHIQHHSSFRVCNYRPGSNNED